MIEMRDAEAQAKHIERQRQRCKRVKDVIDQRNQIRQLNYVVMTEHGEISCPDRELYNAATALAFGYKLGNDCFWWVETRIGA